jgi:hypothetical protein
MARMQSSLMCSSEDIAVSRVPDSGHALLQEHV